MGETFYCQRCKTTTHHKDAPNDKVRCVPCGLIRSRPCSHDLIEADSYGHVSCTDCRMTFA
jgi:hypothetical protein